MPGFAFDIQFTITGDVALNRKLGKFESRTLNAKPAFEDILGVIEEAVRYQYRTQGEDAPWAELSAAYAARKRRQYGVFDLILIASGKLYRSETQRDAPGAIAQAGPDFAMRGTSLMVTSKHRVWNLGLIHQKPRAGKRPQRKQFVLRKGDQAKIVTTVRNYIFQQEEASATYVTHPPT